MIFAIVGITAALIVLLWGWIRTFHMDCVAPWVESLCGPTARKVCDDVFCVANRGVSMTRRAGKKLWSMFVSLVRKSVMEFEKCDSEHYQVKTRTVITTPAGGFRMREESREIHESALPFPVRKQLYDKNTDKACVDSLEIVRRQYEEQLADEA